MHAILTHLINKKYWILLAFCLFLVSGLGLFFSPQVISKQSSITPTIPVELVQAWLTQEATKVPSITPIPTILPTTTFTPTDTPQPTTTPSPIPTPTLPVDRFLKISGHHQYFEIGCETSAAVDWAQYYGVQITQYDFQFSLPQSDNPDYGFVGSVRSKWGQVPPYAYGVHAGPIADLLVQYNVQAKAVKNYTLEEVKGQIARDNPVIAWVIGNMVSGVPAEYTDKQGRKTIVAAYEHVVILTGYNDTTQRIRYLNNGRFFEIPYENFLISWNVLGNMAVVRD